MNDIAYASCNCGGKHGTVPVYEFVNERGRVERHCLPGYNARFGDCPGCKGRIMDGSCPKGCRSCATHGWHAGRACKGCTDASAARWAKVEKWVWRPLRWSYVWIAAAVLAILAVSVFLLSIPFTMLLGYWFLDHGFTWLAWAVMAPIPLVIVAIVAARGVWKDQRG